MLVDRDRTRSAAVHLPLTTAVPVEGNLSAGRSVDNVVRQHSSRLCHARLPEISQTFRAARSADAPAPPARVQLVAVRRLGAASNSALVSVVASLQERQAALRSVRRPPRDRPPVRRGWPARPGRPGRSSPHGARCTSSASSPNGPTPGAGSRPAATTDGPQPSTTSPGTTAVCGTTLRCAATPPTSVSPANDDAWPDLAPAARSPSTVGAQGQTAGRGSHMLPYGGLRRARRFRLAGEWTSRSSRRFRRSGPLRFAA
jgi:hypothetical protein